MKKKPLLFLLILGAVLSLSACGGSSGSSKKCNGDTCKIGHRYQPEKKAFDFVIR